MTDDLRRLVDSADARISSVLRAGLEDEPSAERVAKAARALGLSSVALVAAAQSTKAVRGAAQLGTGSKLAQSSLSPVLGSFSKGLVFALLIGGAATSAVRLLHTEKAPSPSAKPALAPTTEIVISHSAPTALVRPAPVPATPVSPIPLPAVASALVDSHGSAPPTDSARSFSPDRSSHVVTAHRDDLALELAVLTQARRALLSGDPEGALVILAQRDHFSTLDAEARLLRVQALVKAGRSAEAQALAKATLESGAHEAYACRLIKIAGFTSPACTPPPPVRKP